MKKGYSAPEVNLEAYEVDDSQGNLCSGVGFTVEKVGTLATGYVALTNADENGYE